jgi:hypothetical protein
VERFVTIDKGQDAVDQLLAFEVADLTKRQVATEMVVAVGVAAGTAERTFAGDFDGHRRRVAGKDPPHAGRIPCIASLYQASARMSAGLTGRCTMKRRTLLQSSRGPSRALLPLDRIGCSAQARELTPAAIAMLHEIAQTVSPVLDRRAPGSGDRRQVVAWTRGYREGVPLTHGYGHPRLDKCLGGGVAGAGYVRQLAALDAEARAKGGRCGGARSRVAAGAARLPRSAQAGAQGAAAAPGVAACRGRSDGVLLQGSEANDHAVQRDDQPRGLPPDRDHDETAAAAGVTTINAETAEP